MCTAAEALADGILAHLNLREYVDPKASLAREGAPGDRQARPSRNIVVEFEIVRLRNIEIPSLDHHGALVSSHGLDELRIGAGSPASCSLEQLDSQLWSAASS